MEIDLTRIFLFLRVVIISIVLISSCLKINKQVEGGLEINISKIIIADTSSTEFHYEDYWAFSQNKIAILNLRNKSNSIIMLDFYKSRNGKLFFIYESREDFFRVNNEVKVGIGIVNRPKPDSLVYLDKDECIEFILPISIEMDTSVIKERYKIDYVQDSFGIISKKYQYFDYIIKK